MASLLEKPAGLSTHPEHRARPATGRFMLTLCRLAAPVAIRPPQSPQLKRFTFFTSRERAPDGSESLYLHMGYFETLTDAERWVEAIHGRFPDATATIAPSALLRPPISEVSAVPPAESAPGVPQSIDFAPVEDKSLSDTQVLSILEKRRVGAVHDIDERNCEQIALLRPEDTSTRHALKEAVVQGAAVSFAVQLQWSARPIDLSRIPALAIFKAYTLYALESRRDGSARHFLRLGFFGDPVSAKQIAVQVRSNFASAAVVPVAEQEVTCAREATIETTSIPYLVQQRTDRTPNVDSTPGAPKESKGMTTHRSGVRRPETLKETLQRLAEREMLTDPDSLGESGVRHLRVDDVQERARHGRS
jgi:hypothetical protein